MANYERAGQYAIPFEHHGLSRLEQYNQRDPLTAVCIMDPGQFRANWGSALREGRFKSGWYGGETLDDSGMPYPTVTFDTHTGGGIGRAVNYPAIFCAAFTPEGASAMVPIRPGLFAATSKLSQTMSLELFNFRNFVKRHLQKSGRIIMTGENTPESIENMRALAELINPKGLIPLHQLHVDQVPVASFSATPAPKIHRGIHTMFFFPGKAINKEQNYLIMVGGEIQNKPTGGNIWLHGQFYPSKKAV